MNDLSYLHARTLTTLICSVYIDFTIVAPPKERVNPAVLAFNETIPCCGRIK